MIRFSTHDNPHGLRIGEVVRVRRICTVSYLYDVRQMFFDDFGRSAIVIGSTRKALGTYQQGRRFGDPPDWEPARLKVANYVRLYVCRTKFSGPEFLVHPDDITPP